MQTMFGKYLQENPPEKSGVYELKISKGNSLPFDSVKEHQIKGLMEAEKGLFHKISDSPIFAGSKMRFTKPKPFDCLFIFATSYVVILFYKPRKPKNVYLIKIRKFITEKENSNRKSLTEERVREIADEIIII